AANEFSIEPHRRISHRAVDLETELSSLLRWRNSKVLSIPADAPPWQLARLPGILLFERPLDTPIVRQIQLPPAAIIETFLSIGDISTEISFGSRRFLRAICEFIPGCDNPGFDLLVGQLS